MLKVKVLLAAGLFVCAIFSATYASADSSTDLENDEIPSSDYLPDVDKKTVGVSEESELPFQEELDMDVVVVYPPMDLEEKPEKYTVKKGDSLSRISKEYNISLDELMSWSGLTGDLIHPGDVLIVNGNPEDVKVVEFEPYEGEPSKSNVAAVTPPAATPPAPAKSASKQAEKPSPPTAVSKTAKAAKAAIVPKAKAAASTAPSSGGAEMLVTATAYTAYCNGCSGKTASGIDLRANPNQKVIAVDPNIIPLGTRVWVEGYGEAIAGDTGGAIKGNKIDVFLASQDSAVAWGVKQVRIKVLN